MKRIVTLFLVLFFILGMKGSTVIYGQDIKPINEKMIRFHVVANSDAAQDQALKLKVKNSVVEYMQEQLKNCDSLEDAREIIIKNENNIKEIAQNIIIENGYDYSVQVVEDKESFPIKCYGNIVLPEGIYEACKITIGSGKGQNWWCVMFPPLCFVDTTKGDVSTNQTREAMSKTLSKNEINQIDNSTKENKSGEKIKLKLKILEVIKNIKL
jgi:stage II sporulation protein R